MVSNAKIELLSVVLVVDVFVLGVVADVLLVMAVAASLSMKPCSEFVSANPRSSPRAQS